MTYNFLEDNKVLLYFIYEELILNGKRVEYRWMIDDLFSYYEAYLDVLDGPSFDDIAEFYKYAIKKGWATQETELNTMPCDSEGYITLIDDGTIKITLTELGERKFISLIPFHLLWASYLREEGVI